MRNKLPSIRLVRMAILFGTYTLYVLGFHVLYPLTGAGTAALGFAPAVVAGLLLGIRGSLVCGILSFPLSLSLFFWVGDQKNATNLPAAFVGNLAISLAGLGIAWMRSLVDRMNTQAQALREEHQALREEMEKRKQAEERLVYEALHDPLTSLPNRRLFRDRLEHAVERNRRRPDAQFAVAYLDFDRFKTVNDSLGHNIGDQLLTSLAQRLKTSVRAMDTVARMGGDEFAILIETVLNEDEAIGIVQRIQRNLAEPFEIQANSITMTASIGIVMPLLQYQEIDDIIRDADIAMYSAKVSGKNGYKVFDAAMREQAKAELQLENSNNENGVKYLYQLTRSLRQAHTRKEMLPILLDQAIHISQAARGAIYLLEGGSRPGFCFYMPEADGAVTDWFQPNDPLWLKALAEESQPACLEAVEQPAGLPAETRIAFALRSTSGAAGILALGFPAPYSLDEDGKRVLMALAEIAGSALQRSGTMEMLEQRVADRTRELSALYDLALLMTSQSDLGQILHDSLCRVLKPVGAQAAALFLYNAEENTLNLTAQVALPNEILSEAHRLPLPEPLKTWLETSHSPMLAFRGQSGIPGMPGMPDLPGIPGMLGMPCHFSTFAEFGSVVNVPVRFESQTLGLLSVLWEEIEDIAAENIALLSTVAMRLGEAIQNDVYRKQAEQAVVLEERNRLARQLHDSVTQSLYSLALLAEAGRDMAARGDTVRLDRCLQGLQNASLQALREMRLLLFELRAPDMQDKNLIEALQSRLAAVERRAGIPVELRVEGSVELSIDYQAELYQIASEALNNILKHSQASQVCLAIRSSPDAFRMEVEDNGCGFDPQAVTQGGMGLDNMQERTRRLGGEFSIASQPGKGTRIAVSFG